jgi:Tfp pilus assembly protein PilF
METMTTESTVLLVHTNEPPQGLVEGLEKRGVFVETAHADDFESTLTVVGPDLVLHSGSMAADAVVAVLAKTPKATRVRLAVLSERAALENMRRLDRGVVVSVLPNDLPEKTLIDRIVLLANRKGLAAASVVPRPLASVRPQVTEGSVIVPWPLLGAAPQGAGARGAKRVVLVDDDVMRADAFAVTLRKRGYEVQIVPPDPGRTRWLLLRRFGPDILVTDRGRPPHAWLEHLQGDEQLAATPQVAVPYLRLFDETSGGVRAISFVDRIEGRAVTASVPPPAEADDEHNRPTLIAGDEEDRPTLVVDDSHRQALDAAARTPPPPPAAPPPPAMPPPSLAAAKPAAQPHANETAVESLLPESVAEVDDVDEIEDLDAPGSERPASQKPAPAAAERVAVTSLPGTSLASLAAAAGEPSSPPSEKTGDVGVLSVPGAPPLREEPSSGKARWLLVGAGVLLIGGAAFALKGRFASAPGAAASVAAPTVAAATPAPSAQAKGSEVKSKEAAASVQPARPEPSTNPWVNPDDESVPRCERQGEYASLPEGDAAQASRTLDKARSVLVLGDWSQSRDLMCRAVLMDPQSLALEGLAESYLTLHAPQQAKLWSDKALAARPERVRTLEIVGDVENQVGSLDASRAHLIKALGVPAEDQKSLDYVAESLVKEAASALSAKNPTRAEVLYRRAATLSPTNASAPAGVARTLLIVGRNEQAALWVNVAVERSSSHPDVLVAQGDLAFSRGDTKTARELYERVLAEKPNHYIARLQLARVLSN